MAPLNGNNRRMYELARALSDTRNVHLIVYLEGSDLRAQFLEAWHDTTCKVHFLQRKPRLRYLRSMIRGEALPTVDRNFEAEANLIVELSNGNPGSRLFLDNNLVAPLARYFHSGVVVSGPDCMSRLFGQVAIHARSVRERWHNRFRSWFARNNERRWYHVAEVAHVVSRMDRDALRLVNPVANIRVIPLGLSGPKMEALRAWESRRSGVVWANLDFAPTRAGVRQLIEFVQARVPGALQGWTLLGKASPEAALSMLPGLGSSGIRYLPWAKDLSGLLGCSRVVVCPDVGGAGQKNRCLDAMAHGCVVVGLPEVFRDLGGQPGHNYMEVSSFADLFGALDFVEGERGKAMSVEARLLFEARFSHKALASTWSEMLDGMHPLRRR